MIENALTSRMPTQKTGTATPSCEIADRAMPYQVSDFQAATKPMTRARTRATLNASRVRGIVTASRDAISGPTGSDVMNDCPRLNESIPANHAANCCRSGWSEPTCALAAAICSGVALIDSNAFDGSPGSTRRRRNSTTMASSSETTRKAKRRMRYVVIECSRVDAPERGPCGSRAPERRVGWSVATSSRCRTRRTASSGRSRGNR